MPRLRLGKCAGVRPHDEGLHRNLALYGLYSHYSAMTDLFRSGEPLKAASLLPEAQEMEEKMRSAAGFYGAPEDV